MKGNEVIPSGLVEIKESEIMEKVALAEVFRELSNASNRFVFYEKEGGEIRVLFDNIDAVLYACMVAKLSQGKYNKIYEFFRFVLEGVYWSKKCTKKGYERAVKISQHL